MGLREAPHASDIGIIYRFPDQEPRREASQEPNRPETSLGARSKSTYLNKLSKNQPRTLARHLDGIAGRRIYAIKRRAARKGRRVKAPVAPSARRV